MASFSVEDENIDEIEKYKNGRYIGSPEACWKLFGFEIYGNEPAV